VLNGSRNVWSEARLFTVGCLNIHGNDTLAVKNYFDGKIGDVELLDYTLMEPQITALYYRVNSAWQLLCPAPRGSAGHAHPVVR
jgi:hypothetical protein